MHSICRSTPLPDSHFGCDPCPFPDCSVQDCCLAAHSLFGLCAFHFFLRSELLLGAFAESPLADLWGDLFYPVGTRLNSVSAVYPDLCCGMLVGFGIGDVVIPGSFGPQALGALHRFGWFWQPEKQRPVTEDPQVNCSIPANLLGL